MGITVSVEEAARLTGRSERTIFRWIAAGRLAAEPVGLRAPRPGIGPSRWRIDVDALAQLPGITLDAAFLAELERRAAEQATAPGVRLAERVARLEQEVTALWAYVKQQANLPPSVSAPEASANAQHDDELSDK